MEARFSDAATDIVCLLPVTGLLHDMDTFFGQGEVSPNHHPLSGLSIRADGVDPLANFRHE